MEEREFSKKSYRGGENKERENEVCPY